MKIAKKLSRVVIALAVCMLLVVTAWAANEIFVTYSATLNDYVLCVNELDKTVTLAVVANKTVETDEGVIEMDSLTAQVNVPKELKLAGIANEPLKFDEDNYNIANGMILWYSGDAEDVENNLLAKVTINVPAGTPAGTYEIAFDIIDISREWGTSWENGTKVYATLTVAGHADGDDNDHLCDTCQGVVEGATCTYVPGEYVWNEANSACSVVGTCACGETATANATVTSVTTEGTCVTEEKTTYTATFTETWADTQTKADVVTGEKNPDNHTGNNHLEKQKEATATEDGYTGDLVCECGHVVETGKTIGKHQVDADKVDTFTDVPAAVVGGEGAQYETVTEMEAAMTTGTLTEIQKDLPDVAADDVTTQFYDVVLTYYDTETDTWKKADTEHFPEDGKIVVDIPVADLAHHTYYVAHVYSETAFGGTAGDIEYPEVTEYTDPESGDLYIRFTVTGLSPISVSYVRDDCKWVDNGYTDNKDGVTHIHHQKCEIDGTETNDVTEDHAYDAITGLCVCGAKKPEEVTGLKGDVNLDGTVDMDDVIALLCHVMKVDGEIITDATSLAMGEVTGNTSLDMDDVIKILQYVMKAGVESLD